MAQDFRSNTKTLKSGSGYFSKKNITLGIGTLGILGFLVWKFLI